MIAPIETPLAGLTAFDDSSERSLWSQAAQIVGIGVQLSGHSDVLSHSYEDAETLRIPRVKPFAGENAHLTALHFAEDHEMGDVVQILLEPGHSSAIMNSCENADWRGIERPLQRGVISWLVSLSNTGSALTHRILPSRHLNALRELWHICDAQGIPEAAAAFLHVGLRSPYLILRTTSAAQIAWLEKKTPSEVTKSLLEGCCSRDETISQMSSSALYRIDPTHPLVRWTSDTPMESKDERHWRAHK